MRIRVFIAKGFTNNSRFYFPVTITTNFSHVNPSINVYPNIHVLCIHPVSASFKKTVGFHSHIGGTLLPQYVVVASEKS